MSSRVDHERGCVVITLEGDGDVGIASITLGNVGAHAARRRAWWRSGGTEETVDATLPEDALVEELAVIL